jgi:hypothetical protein
MKDSFKWYSLMYCMEFFRPLVSLSDCRPVSMCMAPGVLLLYVRMFIYLYVFLLGGWIEWHCISECVETIKMLQIIS